MTQQIILSGSGGDNLGEQLRLTLLNERPRAIGIASAFVSNEGIRYLVDILRRCENPECRLIAGIDSSITHPEALYSARDHGLNLRLASQARGIFHPKLYVAGHRFLRTGRINNLCCVYVGSSNLTNGGLTANLECGLITSADGCPVSASNVFADLWRSARPATDAELRNYAARFAEHARRRSVSELSDLGINDSLPLPTDAIDLRAQHPPGRATLRPEFAVAAWAGLQSFTGEYRFQIEFPRNAGLVISQLIRAQVQLDGGIDVYCTDDGTTRHMQYKFYLNNSMFRLNVPNDVPGVEWARAHRDGLAIVEQGPRGGAPLRIRLLTPGAEAREILGRSVALGTWGKTPTRAYGWY